MRMLDWELEKELAIPILIEKIFTAILLTIFIPSPLTIIVTGIRIPEFKPTTILISEIL